MKEKKELTTEELEKQYAELGEKYQALGEQLKQKKQEDADRKQAELELDKESRLKEIDEAHKHYKELLNAFIRDYGSYATSTSAEDLLNSIFSPWWKI